MSRLLCVLHELIILRIDGYGLGQRKITGCH